MTESRRCLLNRRMLIIVVAILFINYFFFQKEQQELQIDSESFQAEYTSLVNEYENKVLSSEDVEVLSEELEQENASSSYDSGKCMAIQFVLEEVEHLSSYSSYLQEIQDKVETSTKFAIFADEDSYSYQNIRKTATDFSGLDTSKVKLVKSLGLEKVLSFSLTNYLIIFLEIVLVLIFLEERKKGLWPTVHIGAAGRFTLTRKRIGIMAVFSVITTLLLFGESILISYRYYGGVSDYSAAIQSIASFRACTFSLSIGQFIIAYLAIKCIVVFGLGMFIWGVMSLLKNANIGLIIIFVILIGEYTTYTWISSNSYVNELKYINVMMLLNTKELFATYCNMEIGTKLYSIKEGISVIFTILFVVVVFSTIIICSRKRPFGKTSRVFAWMERIRKRVAPFLMSSSLVLGELKKILICNRGIIFLLVLAYLQYGEIASDTMYYSSENIQMYRLCEKYAGPINQEVTDFIEQKETDYEQAEEEYEQQKEKYTNNQLTNEEWENAQATYENALGDVDGFYLFEEMVENLTTYQEETKENVWIVNPFGYEYFYGSTDKTGEDLLALKALLCIILLASTVFSYEKQMGITGVIRTGRNGREPFVRAKFIAIVILSGVVFLMTYGVELYNMHYLFGFKSLNAPIKSLSIFRSVPVNCSILTFMILLYLLRFLTILGTGCLAMIVSLYCKNIKSSMIYSTLLIGGTSILFYIGIAALEQVSLLSIINGVGVIGGNSEYHPLRLSIFFVITILLCIVGNRRWCKKGNAY